MLVQVTEQCYYIQSPAKIGIVRVADDEVCLIDSGNDKSAGRMVRKILDANGWKLRAIYCTHSHADHIGGNRYLQSQTGCRIYAPGAECALTNHPFLEPALLYGGNPLSALRCKFLQAQESHAEPLSPELLPAGFTALPLPGHSPDMVGYRAPDGVVYLADSLCSRATLEKYRIGYVYDVAAYLQTLDMLQTMTARCFIPSHADATDDIRELARYNAEQVHAVAECILSLCREPVCFDTLLSKLFDTLHLSMTLEQYALIGSTLRSYLSWLHESGKICLRIENNQALWQSM